MNEKFKAQILYTLDALNEIAYALKKYKEGVKDAEYYFYAAEKKTEEAVQTVISINQDILADYFNEVSKSYFDSFMEVEKLDLFSKNELDKLAHTTGFRNRLVHEYMDLNRDIVVKSMNNILKIYPKYIQKIRKWLDKQ